MGRRLFSLLLSWGLIVSGLMHADESGRVWSVPRVGHNLQFPRDHGSHPDFKIEWWYLTGHLFSGEERFGFQATFFRLGQEPADIPEGELFGGEQIYMAHMGLSAPGTGAFLHEVRLNRGGWDAGGKLEDLDVFNGNWSLKRNADGVMQLEGSIHSEATLSLTLVPEKEHVIFGEEGISRKGPEGTAASYYITFPRLNSEGEISVNGERYAVSGEAWMDHEISSSQLDRNQIGWDWACIQFFDGREIMGYVLRTESGEPSQYSKLVWISETGDLTHQNLESYTWTHDGEWKSGETGAIYPVSPRIETIDPRDGKTRRLKLIPVMENQEIAGGPGGVSYWEGACDVIDEASGKPVGRAYLEMTGYAESIADKLQ
ncbi:lipocalin-like domain-containing protein [Verrucomicrobiales bacterium BCK34]|nr:lipocalin-like domain-containing protein [Verrucomicrobiales bacterium BCK34]